MCISVGKCVSVMVCVRGECELVCMQVYVCDTCECVSMNGYEWVHEFECASMCNHVCIDPVNVVACKCANM